MLETKPPPPRAQPSLKRPHRLALATLAPRTFAFCHTFGLTVWIALAEGSGWSSETPAQEVLTLADNRMYDDKTQRRKNRVPG